MTQPYDYAWAFVSALAGDPNTAVIDWRALHDSDRADAGHARRGTLPQWWAWICQMNATGYGIFCTVAEMDGNGRELHNVQTIRAHYIDLDGIDAQASYDRACGTLPLPTFATVSSPGKYHVYWSVTPYSSNERFTQLQRKLAQVFHGDKRIIDATRVMRVPGTIHLKNPAAPHLVTCHALGGYGHPLTVDQLETVYISVNVIDGGTGQRHDLGDPDLAAPSLDWLRYALTLIDPNTLDRAEWIAVTAAVKQAGWRLADAVTLRLVWDQWCARYARNDPGENEKQWRSLRSTELGWRSLVARVPTLRASLSFGPGDTVQTVEATPGQPMLHGEFMNSDEQRIYFKGCVFVTKLGQILVPDGRFLNATQFNGAYGGKQFEISRSGKTTDEPWRAALRSTLWQIPKVDHIRFLPHREHGVVIPDSLGRKGVNVYKPVIVERVVGDPTPFLNHIAALIPDDADRRIIFDYIAHNVKYPGYKIPWAPVIQSVEGAGKNVMKNLLTHVFGTIYVHFPNSQELTSGGSKFNAWLHHKLFILADEIKVDDKRDLIEMLKPLISEELIEIQSKGVDQELEDNYANWMFFTNYKDAVPISKNGRRYAIFYSPLQTEHDLLARGMNDPYFDALYGWLKADGAAIVTDWLMNYPIERGKIPMRAPKTTSWDEAVKVSRTPVERCIMEAIEQQLPGFRGGWVSVQSAIKYVRDQGVLRGLPAPYVVSGILESMGYVASGRAHRSYFPEANGSNVLSDLYHIGGVADVMRFGVMQGWEA